jgi:hypothetical protein
MRPLGVSHAYSRILPIAPPNVLVVTRCATSGSNYTNIGAFIKHSLSVLNACDAPSVYLKGPNFLPFSIPISKSMIGTVIVEYLKINPR